MSEEKNYRRDMILEYLVFDAYDRMRMEFRYDGKTYGLKPLRNGLGKRDWIVWNESDGIALAVLRSAADALQTPLFDGKTALELYQAGLAETSDDRVWNPNAEIEKKADCEEKKGFSGIDEMQAHVFNVGSVDFIYKGELFCLTHYGAGRAFSCSPYDLGNRPGCLRNHPRFWTILICREDGNDNDAPFPDYATSVEAMQAKLFDGMSMEELLDGNLADFSCD